MKNEDEVQQLIRLESPKIKVDLFRNNSGAYTDSTGRVVRYGLANESKKQNDKFKSSDLIGVTQIVVTPDMIGKKLAVFTAIECKKEEWNPDKSLDAREQAQKNFIDFIVERGGIAGFSNSVDSFRKLIGR